MPRTTDESHVSDTPFARVLTAFMWSKQPPWSAAKTAAVLGIHRTRVANWCFHGIVPELDVMMSVMARLGIPMRFLIEAYEAAGMPAPPLDLPPEQLERERAQREATIGPAASRYYGGYTPPAAGTAEGTAAQAQAAEQETAIPASRRGRGGGVHHTAGMAAEPARPTAAEDAEDRREANRREEWEKMIAHTREVMTMAGMPEAALNAMLAELEDTRRGKPSAAQRHIAAEHQPDHQPERRHDSAKTRIDSKQP